MFILFAIFVIFVLLVVLIVTSCITTEKFTAPGLTLTNPPKWFPKYSAKKYNMDDWKVKMYLDRYPMYQYDGGPKEESNYITPKESDKIASAYRFWKQ